MSGSRMEAFSDGVLAIVTTIMRLKLDIPKSASFFSIKAIMRNFLAYVLCYVYVGIYRANHHHLLSVVDFVSGRLLWRNLFWIFWMSFIPMATEWIGLNPFEGFSALFYGIILFMCATSYNFLQSEVIRISGKESEISKSIRNDKKEKVPFFYML